MGLSAARNTARGPGHAATLPAIQSSVIRLARRAPRCHPISRRLAARRAATTLREEYNITDVRGECRKGNRFRDALRQYDPAIILLLLQAAETIDLPDIPTVNRNPKGDEPLATADVR